MLTEFENQYTCTKEYYKEYYRYTYFRKPIIVIINIILSISFVIGILSIMFPNIIVLDNNMAEANIATALIALCFQIYVFVRNKNLAYDRDLEKNKGNPIEVKILIMDDNIHIFANSNKDINIEFTNIEKVIKAKNYYILVTKAKLYIALKKDGFVNGTTIQFEKFLNKKNL